MTFILSPKFLNVANVILNGKETRFGVRKDAHGFYNIEYWFKGEYRAFNSSWYSSESKEEIKEKLLEIVGKRIEVDVFSSKGRMRVA